MQGLNRAEVLSAKPGDIIWFSLKADISVKEARAFVDDLLTAKIIPEGAHPLVTFDNIVSSARVSGIEDIRAYRNSLDEIIAAWQLNEEYAEEH